MVSRAALAGRAIRIIEEARDRSTPAATLWDLEHRCSVLKELAERSVAGARNLLYSMLSREPGTSDIVGATQIVELDGADGLVFVARRIGQWLARDSSLWVDNVPLDSFDKRHGPGAGLAVLARVRTDDLDVGRSLSVLEHPARAERGHVMIPHLLAPDVKQSRLGRMQSIGAAEVISLVRSDSADGCFWLTGWGCHADTDAREVVFAALLEEVEPGRIARFLRVFTRCGPPRFDERLLGWVDIQEDDVSRTAVMVLAHVSDSLVREKAIALLARAKTACKGVQLLTGSYLPGDHRWIESALQEWTYILTEQADENELHWLLGDVVDLFEARPAREAARSLLFVYEHTPCTNCRLRALKLLASTHSLTSWIVDEARLDASHEIRELLEDEDIGNGRR